MHALSFIVITLINTFCYTNTLSNLKSDSYVFINFKFAHNNNLTYVSIEKRIVSEFKENAAIINHVIKFLMNIKKKLITKSLSL